MNNEPILCSFCGVKTGLVATTFYKNKPCCEHCWENRTQWEADAIDRPIRNEAMEGGDV